MTPTSSPFSVFTVLPIILVVWTYVVWLCAFSDAIASPSSAAPCWMNVFVFIFVETSVSDLAKRRIFIKPSQRRRHMVWVNAQLIWSRNLDYLLIRRSADCPQRSFTLICL